MRPLSFPHECPAAPPRPSGPSAGAPHFLEKRERTMDESLNGNQSVEIRREPDSLRISQRLCLRARAPDRCLRPLKIYGRRAPQGESAARIASETAPSATTPALQSATNQAMRLVKPGPPSPASSRRLNGSPRLDRPSRGKPNRRSPCRGGSWARAQQRLPAGRRGWRTAPPPPRSKSRAARSWDRS